MKKILHYIGIDVDDQSFHISAISSETRESQQFKTKATTASLIKVLRKYVPDLNKSALVAYEAGHLGYSLMRALDKKGITCKVIAPTSIPKSANERVKNDRLDSEKIAIAMRNNAVSYVNPPSEEQEADRQLVRTRGDLVSQASDIKRNILSMCRTLGLDYTKETNKKSNWTPHHFQYLKKKVPLLQRSAAIALEAKLKVLEFMRCSIADVEYEIEKLAHSVPYKKTVAALRCFKGIQTTVAMLLATELYSIKRFAHPRQLTAYVGLDIREYSSGGKQSQMGISKMGNKHVRRALVEACQFAFTAKAPLKRLKQAHKKTEKRIIDIADKCRNRLSKKGIRMLLSGKPRNKAKVACAREMLGFIWETLCITTA
ncbi:IS110 family transposase [Sulfobacillus acidophilus]|uniref:IS110 family transposase n=1 Tax=Sulfobacillus acidophilus TaxID=53633 RepID=A0ABS3AYV7_9FIRM|nr:IS110 family transposase [Sulfobacillus acidophilus]